MDKEEKKITIRDLLLPIALSLVLIILISFSFAKNAGDGAGLPERKQKIFYGRFDTVSVFYDNSGLSDSEFTKVCTLVEDKLDHYHRLFDIYNSYDGIINVKDLNESRGKGAIDLSRELFDFLEYSKEMHRLTSGEVNIAMGAVLSIWHDYRTEGAQVPDRAELEAAALHTDINSLILNREDLTAEISDPLMLLDVGAIAKGYTAERIAETLSAEGYSGVALDLGGNIRAVGKKPDGSGWHTGIKDPDVSSDGYLYEFELADSSAVTSGNYERYYTVGDKVYHHIIDKDTLMPSEHFVSVTVITHDSGLADALSTALFNMTYEEGIAIIDTLENIKVIWLTHDGEIKIR